MSLTNPDWRANPIIEDDYRTAMREALASAELNRTLGRFYQDLVLRGIPSPETHLAKLREILEGKTQPGT